MPKELILFLIIYACFVLAVYTYILKCNIEKHGFILTRILPLFIVCLILLLISIFYTQLTPYIYDKYY